MSRKKIMTESALIRMTADEKLALNAGMKNANEGSFSRYMVKSVLSQQANHADSDGDHRESRDALARSLRALFAEQVEQKNALDALARRAKMRTQKGDSYPADQIKTLAQRVAQNAAKIESYFLEIERFV